MLTTIVLAAMLTTAEPGWQGTVYDFTAKNIDGKEVALKDFRGKALVIVNVASKCGQTPQYAGLEALYRKYREKGLVVLGFPANQFNGQEPGTDAEIKAFCTGTYDVTFPMFSKIVVKGDGIHPLYRWLVQETTKEEVEWNFAKFVVGRDGKVLARFHFKTKPDDAEFVAAVERTLSQGAPGE